MTSDNDGVNGWRDARLVANTPCTGARRPPKERHPSYQPHRLGPVTLEPDPSDRTCQPLVFEDLAEGELRIVAELLEVSR